MHNNDELERQRFEAVIREKFGDLVDLRICANGDGEYLAWDAQVAYHAWQASRAAIPLEAAQKQTMKSYFYRVEFDNKERQEESGIVRAATAQEAFSNIVEKTKRRQLGMEYLGEEITKERYYRMSEEERTGFLGLLGLRPGSEGFKGALNNLGFETTVGKITAFSLVDG